jgi:hypothetical protein
MKTTIIIGAIIIVVLSVTYIVLPAKHATAPLIDNSATTTATTTTLVTTPTNTTTEPDTPDIPIPQPIGKIKATNFTGTLEQVNTGCFADGECYVVVDGKHITLIMGRREEEVGSIIGVPSIGDLEPAIGAKVEVYAKDNLDGTYTLYGSKGFYVKVLHPTDKSVSAESCVVGGCSGQLCVDPSKDQGVTNCMYSPQYACYKTAECKRQTTGECGWTETSTLKQCLATAG